MSKYGKNLCNTSKHHKKLSKKKKSNLDELVNLIGETEVISYKKKRKGTENDKEFTSNRTICISSDINEDFSPSRAIYISSDSEDSVSTKKKSKENLFATSSIASTSSQSFSNLSQRFSIDPTLENQCSKSNSKKDKVKLKCERKNQKTDSEDNVSTRKKSKENSFATPSIASASSQSYSCLSQRFSIDPTLESQCGKSGSKKDKKNELKGEKRNKKTDSEDAVSTRKKSKENLFATSSIASTSSQSFSFLSQRFSIDTLESKSHSKKDKKNELKSERRIRKTVKVKKSKKKKVDSNQSVNRSFSCRSSSSSSDDVRCKRIKLKKSRKIEKVDTKNSKEIETKPKSKKQKNETLISNSFDDGWSSSDRLLLKPKIKVNKKKYLKTSPTSDDNSSIISLQKDRKSNNLISVCPLSYERLKRELNVNLSSENLKKKKDTDFSIENVKVDKRKLSINEYTERIRKNKISFEIKKPVSLEIPKKVIDKVTIEEIEKMEVSFAKNKSSTHEASTNILNTSLTEKTDKSTMSFEKEPSLYNETKLLLDKSKNNIRNLENYFKLEKQSKKGLSQYKDKCSDAYKKLKHNLPKCEVAKALNTSNSTPKKLLVDHEQCNESLNTSTSKENLSDQINNSTYSIISKLKNRRHTIDTSTLHRIRELTDNEKHFSVKSLSVKSIDLPSHTKSNVSHMQVSSYSIFI